MPKKCYSKLNPLLKRLERKSCELTGDADGSVLGQLKENIHSQRMLAQWQEVLLSEQEGLLMKLDG